MTPTNQLGLSTGQSANMLGTLGASVNAAMPPDESETSQENPMQKIALQFQGAWKALESMNGDYGGDADKFRNVQKALEDWFSDIAQNIPENSSTSQTNNY
jgi:hypothetical protein